MRSMTDIDIQRTGVPDSEKSSGSISNPVRPGTLPGTHEYGVPYTVRDTGFAGSTTMPMEVGFMPTPAL